MDYIEGHLTRKLALEEIAGALYYSRYYLHRVFSEAVGLTIHDYLQRRQLTEAARLLVFSRKPILEIALLAGYESQQAFTAAFSTMYKQTPRRYRGGGTFYPLQLKYRFEGNYPALKSKRAPSWRVDFARQTDIPCWMELVRLVIDGYPHLEEEEYVRTLRERIDTGQALILKDGPAAVGTMLFSPGTGSVDFLGTHPLYRQRGIQKAFLEKVTGELVKEKQISITTYREGDRADTGQRREIMGLGFVEAEPLVEFGYPTQRFVLPVKPAAIHGINEPQA